MIVVKGIWARTFIDAATRRCVSRATWDKRQITCRISDFVSPWRDLPLANILFV
jgi:hypothetical protein